MGNWRKSSYSGPGDGNECVQVAPTPTHISLRDSKAPDRATLTFPTASFAPFLGFLKGAPGTCLRTPRRAARVAVVDPAGAVLLFRYDNVEVGVHWSLPGGGLEAGETSREGALRELGEETGWTDLTPGPLLCTWEHDFTHVGLPVRQHEHVYVTPGPHRDPAGPGVAAAQEADGILTWRWWSRAELAEEREPVWPPGLARLLDAWEG